MKNFTVDISQSSFQHALSLRQDFSGIAWYEKKKVENINQNGQEGFMKI
jgi:hypothetical protein